MHFFVPIELSMRSSMIYNTVNACTHVYYSCLKLKQLFLYFLTVLPQHEPVITGTKEQYQSGELLQANCTSNGSLPSASLEWKINNVPVSTE